MARRTTAVRNTDALKVEGLNESIRGLRRVDAEAAKEVTKIIREQTKEVALVARQVDSGSQSEPSRKTWIGWRASSTGAGILLRAGRFPRAYATEFGMAEWHIPVPDEGGGMTSRGTVQDALRERTFNEWSGTSRKVISGNTGHVIQPTIRKSMPMFAKRLADRIARWYGRKVETGR